MGKQSQLNGKTFERHLCWWLSQNGYYVIFNERNSAGAQPVDVIAIKDNIATMIECKNLEGSTGRFPLSRIEQNQINAYKMFKSKHNTNFVLAINWNGGVYIIDFGLLQFFSDSIDLKKFTANWRWNDESIH